MPRTRKVSEIVSIGAAHDAALSAEGSAASIAAVVDPDILYDRLFPFVARDPFGGRRLVSSVDPADGAWRMKLEKLDLRGGLKIQQVETVEGGAFFLLAPDSAGNVRVLDKWPKVPPLTYTVEDVETVEGGSRRRFFVLSSDRKVLFAEDVATPIEVAAARGGKGSLAERLDVTTNNLGLPKTPEYGKWWLRQTNQALTGLEAGDNLQFDIAISGDSFSDNAERYVTALTEKLVAKYGDAGGGWVGFSAFDYGVVTPGVARYQRGNARPALYPCTISGAWTVSPFASYSPDNGSITATTAGAKVTLQGPAAPALSGVMLFAEGTANGVVRYRWNGGAWTNLNLQPAGPFMANLAGIPAGGWTLEIETVSGTCTLCGANLLSAAKGVRVHKIAAAGGHLYDLVNVAAASWISMIAALGPKLHMLFIGTNDQSADQAPNVFANNAATWLIRSKQAAPNADRAIIMPPENCRPNNLRAIKDYAAATYPVAVNYKAAWLDLQPYFGETPADYSETSGRSLLEPGPDFIHPTPLGGGRVILGALWDLLTKR